MSSPRKLVKKLIPKLLFRKIEPIGHLFEAMLVSLRYGMPANNLRVIGVTGTNGKTTTSHLIHRMLHEAGYKVGLMTTVAYGVGDDITPQQAHMTTVSSPELNKRLADFRKQGAEWIVLEVTSHSLAQHRVWGIPIEIAVLTNITHEHLDYHGTFERYVAAKKRLFQKAGKHPHGYGVANAEDTESTSFLRASIRGIDYGIEAGELRAHDVQLSSTGSRFIARAGQDEYAIACNIPGEFNVMNSLAAVAVGRHVGLTQEQIEQGIAAVDQVEGRMVTVDEGQDFSVIVDFAHTPDSFEKLLSDVRASTAGRLIVLFGSAGRRDESKRAIQGEIAGHYADDLILTEEDDRDVDGQTILAQIAAGATDCGKILDEDLFLIPNRSAAIQFAVGRAVDADDTVMLLGKGHEKTIERADGEHPWDEMAEARQAIQASK